MKLELGDVTIELNQITIMKKMGTNLEIIFENGEKLNVYCNNPAKVAPGAACFAGSADELKAKILLNEQNK